MRGRWVPGAGMKHQGQIPRIGESGSVWSGHGIGGVGPRVSEGSGRQGRRRAGWTREREGQRRGLGLRCLGP